MGGVAIPHALTDNKTDAALIYQHASRQVDQTIADKLSALIDSTVKDPNDGDEDDPPGVSVPAG